MPVPAVCVTCDGWSPSNRYKQLVEEAREEGLLGGGRRHNGMTTGGGGGGSGGSGSGGSGSGGGGSGSGGGMPHEDKVPLVQRNVAPNQSHNGGSGGAQQQATTWIDIGAYEWGHCKKTHMPKAPRAHFDHVTKRLVLNMDHYCPWMFNVVGYMNYRYFFLFLAYVFFTCVYGILITVRPFMALIHSPSGRGAWKILHADGTASPLRLGSQAGTAVQYTFLLALSIGLAVSLLFFWHVYLVSTAQTTIEFYGNQTRHFRARLRGQRYKNP